MLYAEIVPSAGYLIPSSTIFGYILLGMLISQYIWFAVVFLTCRFAERSFPDSIKDKTHPARSAFHWLMVLPTLLGSAAIELWAFLEVTVRGKGACQHKASKKDGLVVIQAEETRNDQIEAEQFL